MTKIDLSERMLLDLVEIKPTTSWSSNGRASDWGTEVAILFRSDLVNAQADQGLCFLYLQLTHCSLETPERVFVNSADPDQMLQNADQVLYCLQVVQPFFSRNI